VSYSPYRVFYHLKDLENEPIKGIFYRNELQTNQKILTGLLKKW
jgi:hypothetical protein